MTFNRFNRFNLLRRILWWIAAGTLAAGTFWNIWWFTGFVRRFPPREQDPMVAWESRYRKLHDQLLRESYTTGQIGFVTERSLQRMPLNEQEYYDWSALRYFAIPILLEQGETGSPYLIGNFTYQGGPPPALAGYTKIADSGDGLILYKRNAAR
jgi:hypothetical protein